MTVVTDVTTVVTVVTLVTLVILMTDAITKLDEVDQLLPDPPPAYSTTDNDTLHLSDIGHTMVNLVFALYRQICEDPYSVTQLV